MSKAYPSNLTHAQYEFLSDMIPEPKSGGRPREVEMREVLNAIFYVLVEGVRWRGLPGDFPLWQTVYTYFRNWRKDGTWLKIHDSLREWTRIEQQRHANPSEAIIERTFAWVMGCRRLVRDYELLPETSETFIYLAMIRIMVLRLA